MNGPFVLPIVLAAGEGRRWGGPKALAGSGGRSWLLQALERLCQAGFARAIVVLGAEADRVRAETEEVLAGGALEAPGAPEGPGSTSRSARAFPCQAAIDWIVNQRWASGRTGSIASGLRALPPECVGALVHQVDFPDVRSETFRRLALAFLGEPRAREKLLIPVLDGRRGHPIVIGRDLWNEVCSLDPDHPLREWIHARPDRVREVEIADRGIHRNVNRPEDLERNP